VRGRGVAELVVALHCKLEDRGFDSRWCHWDFSLVYCFRSHYGPGVDSPFNRNDYQGYLVGAKGDRCVGLTTLSPSRSDCLKFLGASTSWNPDGLPWPLQGFLISFFIVTFSYWTQPLTFVNTFWANEVNVSTCLIQGTGLCNSVIKSRYVATTRNFSFGLWGVVVSWTSARTPWSYRCEPRRSIYSVMAAGLTTELRALILVRSKAREDSCSFSAILSVFFGVLILFFPRVSTVIVFLRLNSRGFKNAFWTNR
jgi:hypothetical protein